jgi:predicted nucleotidyltransferase
LALMRLTESQKQIIREEVLRAFGRNAQVHVFGSRLDDDQRGGDIDLYIEAEGGAGDLLDRELALYARLQRRLGEQRIDLIVRNPDQPARPVDRHARATGIAL